MIEDLVNLRNDFEKVKNMGWVASLRKGTTGIGYTFETLIGKVEEWFPIPDYNTIEIKTRFRNSKQNIGIMNVTPDGDYLFPIKRVYDEYGYTMTNKPDQKCFYGNFGSSPKYVNRNTLFQLVVNYDEQAVKIIAISKTGETKDINVSWSFDLLREKLETKIKYLALVKADTHFKIDLQYFYYYQITFYMYRGFKTFLKLIEDNTIKVTFMLGCYTTGVKKGTMNSHGVRFEIAEDDLEKLFIKVC